MATSASVARRSPSDERDAAEICAETVPAHVTTRMPASRAARRPPMKGMTPRFGSSLHPTRPSVGRRPPGGQRSVVYPRSGPHPLDGRAAVPVGEVPARLDLLNGVYSASAPERLRTTRSLPTFRARSILQSSMSCWRSSRPTSWRWTRERSAAGSSEERRACSGQRAGSSSCLLLP